MCFTSSSGCLAKNIFGETITHWRPLTSDNNATPCGTRVENPTDPAKVLVPNTAQVFGQSHERIEECGFVFRMVSGVVDAWNTILNLRRRYQCTPSIIRVVGSHAGIANVHKGRITLSATHGIGKPGFRIFAVCPGAGTHHA